MGEAPLEVSKWNKTISDLRTSVEAAMEQPCTAIEWVTEEGINLLFIENSRMSMRVKLIAHFQSLRSVLCTNPVVSYITWWYMHFIVK
jgi:hypothetical protein